MPKRSRKKEMDINEIAFNLIQQVIQSGVQPKEKNPAAVALGRLGGLKGGKARAEKLSPKKRRKIAKMAAIARWKKI